VPLVDVIIPYYNCAKYLPAAIESVIGQTEPDWRIVVVDDGSSDNIEAVVEPYRLALGPKLLFIRQANAGVSAARNRGIRSSDSKFVALLDADDIWKPERLELGIRAISARQEIGLVHSRVAFMDEASTVTGESPSNPPHASGSIARRIYAREIRLFAPAVMFRRTAFDVVGGFDETMRATEDRDLWFRIAARYEVAFVDSVLACYRQLAGSASKNLDRMLEYQLRFLEKHYGQAGCGPRERRAALASMYRDRGWSLRARRSWGAALHSFARACCQQPAGLKNYLQLGGTILEAARDLGT
jgi:glycosyltransferase involved in cell wall biosynthesis